MAALPEIDPRSLMAALQAAQATGHPQPVQAKGGGIAYYVDTQGTPVDKDGAPLGQPKRIVDGSIKPQAPSKPSTPSAPNSQPTTPFSPYGESAGAPMFYGNYDATAGQRPAGDFSTENGALTANPSHAAPAAKKAAAANAAQAAAQAAKSAVDEYNATHPPAWVNGQRMTVATLDAQGHPLTYNFAGSKTPGKPDMVIDPTTGQVMDPKKTAFAALDVGASYGILAGISGDEQFTMSNGAVDVNSGTPAAPGAYGPPGSGDHSYSANVSTGGTYAPYADSSGTIRTRQTGDAAPNSQMTIAEGLQWMVNLSLQNPPAYDLLVKQLKHAGYFGTNPGDMIGGGYSEQAGLGFVKAMKDLSVVQQTNPNVNTTMDQFLSGKTAAAKQAAGDLYQPVNRDYTDPGTLMATAKTAAESAIGRNLTPAETAAFEANFRNQQTSYYNSVDASGKAQAEAKAIGESAPGSAAVAPSADGAANALLQGDQFNQQRANYGVEQYTQALGQLFNVQ